MKRRGVGSLHESGAPHIVLAGVEDDTLIDVLCKMKLDSEKKRFIQNFATKKVNEKRFKLKTHMQPTTFRPLLHCWVSLVLAMVSATDREETASSA